MAGFSVDTEAVSDLARQLAQVCNDLGVAAMPHDLSEADAGAQNVARALRQFHQHWVGQWTTLDDELARVASVVAHAANNYRASDGAVSSAATGDA